MGCIAYLHSLLSNVIQLLLCKGWTVAMLSSFCKQIPWHREVVKTLMIQGVPPENADILLYDNISLNLTRLKTGKHLLLNDTLWLTWLNNIHENGPCDDILNGITVEISEGNTDPVKGGLSCLNCSLIY